SYSELMNYAEKKKISQVTIEDDLIKAQLKTTPPQNISAVPPPQEKYKIAEFFRKNGAEVKFKKPSKDSWYLILLGQTILPIIVIIAIWFFLIRQLQMGAGKGMSFGKARAKLLTENQKKVTFEDVAGVDEARQELEEIVEFLKDPKKFTRLGGRIPKGVLLVGPPGTGKTLLARAIAGEAGVPFFSISGSDFVEMFVGVGASRVRDLFIQGKKHAPCIIFIDEIDAVGRHRGAGLGGGHDEREQTLNQLLVEMDGFESNEGVILIAATNRPDVLDPALLRPGRFDRRVIVHRPDVKGRLGILKVHTKDVPLADDVNLEVIARGTPGFAGADLEILVNEAALTAARKNRKKVTMADFEYAKDKVMMGAERRSLLLSEEEKKLTAYHESGHALVAKKVKNSDPVHKLTIVPRGMALGVMQQLPEDDKHTYSKEYWLDQLAVFFGGRAAETVVFGQVTTGAANDIERATDIARRMVCEWGMSEKLGPLQYVSKEGEVFLGKEVGKPREYSEKTQEEIDAEVKRIIEDRYEAALKIIRENLDTLHRLAQAVLERETLDAEEIDAIVEGRELPAKNTASSKKEEEKEEEAQLKSKTPEKESLKDEELPKKGKGKVLVSA
ncbi:MAG: ATP-dependent zinc metalloprotease FtsH, partial [Candidatus Dadabacteria bacterium]